MERQTQQVFIVCHVIKHFQANWKNKEHNSINQNNPNMHCEGPSPDLMQSFHCWLGVTILWRTLCEENIQILSFVLPDSHRAMTTNLTYKTGIKSNSHIFIIHMFPVTQYHWTSKKSPHSWARTGGITNNFRRLHHWIVGPCHRIWPPDHGWATFILAARMHFSRMRATRRVPTFSDRQNSMIFPGFLVNFQVLFDYF